MNVNDLLQEQSAAASKPQSPAEAKPEIKTETRDVTPSTLPAMTSLPEHELIGGAPVRQWLNEHVTPSLLEGMRVLAKEKPQDPLRYLGEWLVKKSEEQKK